MKPLANFVALLFLSIPLAILVFLVIGLLGSGFENSPASGSRAIAGSILAGSMLVALAIAFSRGSARG